MLGRSSSKLSILVPSLFLVAIPLLAQVAPQQQQGYPPQAGAVPVGDQGAADGQDQGAAGPGVARISLLDGDVSVRRGDSGDYVAAVPNAPVMVQDSIQTGTGARAEVQFDAVNMVRMAQNTELHFTNLENGHFQMELGRGTVTYRMFRNVNAQVEIDTPSISIRPSREGGYRVTVTDNGQTYVTPRAGQVEVYTPKGSQTVSVGQTLVARGPASDPEYQFVPPLNRDDWDAWSDSRDGSLQQAWSNSAPYVPQDVYGTEELAGHGQWVNTPDYGYAWTPSGVSADWTPYSAGRWTWGDDYGWTWVSYDPWGWAPYHYGRWFYSGGYGWCWWPGRLHSHNYWSPALVGFVGFGRGIGVGLGFGSIGWVPLAPYERFHPWWGRGGGFNNVAFAHNTNVVNVYRNARVGNGVMAQNFNQFGRGATGYSRVSGSELRSASLVNGGAPVTPSNQSLHFSNRQTGTIARTNFSQGRFASHSSVPSVQRTSFQQQQRNMQGVAQRAFGGSSVNGRGFGNSAGATTSTSNFARGGQNAGGAGSSYSRYGGSAGGSTSTIPGARSFGNTPGTRNIPQASPSPAGGANSNGWNRFGSMRSGSTYSPSGGRSQLQVSPPLVRERGSYSAPGSGNTRYSTPGGYSTPRYSNPSYQSPRYSAPAQRSAPSGGGSSRAPSGGSRSSGGGGGGGRHR